MKKRDLRRLILLFVCLAALALLAGACKQAAPQEKVVEKPVVQIPPPDVAPNGCSDCHKKEADKDYTLAAEAKKANPSHPAVSATATVKDCVVCHGGAGKSGAKPFRTFLHKAHLNSQNFGPKLHGYCNSCHAMDANTGLISVKGLPAPTT
ncbi:MAG TPA: hypothetical protein VGL40_03525 [Bacillota bacterium]|jgi:hypothetical protein